MNVVIGFEKRILKKILVGVRGEGVLHARRWRGAARAGVDFVRTERCDVLA